MLGKIVSITEGYQFDREPKRKWNSYEGYLILTADTTVEVGIDNGQNCCENWGYCMSEDNIEDFIGATLLGVQVTPTASDKFDVKSDYSGDTMFVDINTDRGTFQIVLYNEHNGYYGHEAVVKVGQQIEEKVWL